MRQPWRMNQHPEKRRTGTWKSLQNQKVESTKIDGPNNLLLLASIGGFFTYPLVNAHIAGWKIKQFVRIPPFHFWVSSHSSSYFRYVSSPGGLRPPPKKHHLENKLLLISINFTPNRNRSCLKKTVLSYVFQAGPFFPTKKPTVGLLKFRRSPEVWTNLGWHCRACRIGPERDEGMIFNTPLEKEKFIDSKRRYVSSKEGIFWGCFTLFLVWSLDLWIDWVCICNSAKHQLLICSDTEIRSYSRNLSSYKLPVKLYGNYHESL